MVTQSSGGGRRPWGRIALLLAGSLGLIAASGAGRARPPAPPPPAADVVIATRPLAESATLTAADVRVVRVTASALTAVMSSELGQVVGRRLLVPVAAGAPLPPAVLGAPQAGRPPARLVPVSIAADRLPGQTHSGDEIDIVAAQSAPGGIPGGRVEVVASGRLISVTGHRGLAPADPNGGGDLVLLVACDEAAGMRLLWAESFAHSLTVVARPEGARPLPGDGGPGT